MIFMIVLKGSLVTGTYSITASNPSSDAQYLSLVDDTSEMPFGFDTRLLGTFLERR
jgi:hypothetical protein